MRGTQLAAVVELRTDQFLTEVWKPSLIEKAKRGRTVIRSTQFTMPIESLCNPHLQTNSTHFRLNNDNFRIFHRFFSPSRPRDSWKRREAMRAGAWRCEAKRREAKREIGYAADVATGLFAQGVVL